MPIFSYNAKDAQGQVVRGTIAADSESEALAMLTERGYVGTSLEQPKPAPRLNADEADELLMVVSHAEEARLPLGGACRAAAVEVSQPRLRRAFRDLADAMDSGASLEEALNGMGDSIPAHMSALLLASAQTGSISHVLPELVEQRKEMRQVRWEIAITIAYPCLILYSALLLFALFGVFIVGPFSKMYEDFGLNLPGLTMALIRWHEFGSWGLLAFLLAVAVTVVLAPLMMSTARRRRLLTWIPFLGVLIRWMSIAEMSAVLAVLIDSGMRLPEAVGHAGATVDDLAIKAVCRQAQTSVEGGALLSDSLQSTRLVPATMIPMVQWGERTESLAEAFRAFATAIEQRVRQRGHIIRVLAPAIIMAFVGVVLAFSVIALFLPLVSMISGLS